VIALQVAAYLPLSAHRLREFLAQAAVILAPLLR